MNSLPSMWMCTTWTHFDEGKIPKNDLLKLLLLRTALSMQNARTKMKWQIKWCRRLEHCHCNHNIYHENAGMRRGKRLRFISHLIFTCDCYTEITSFNHNKWLRENGLGDKTLCRIFHRNHCIFFFLSRLCLWHCDTPAKFNILDASIHAWNSSPLPFTFSHRHVSLHTIYKEFVLNFTEAHIKRYREFVMSSHVDTMLTIWRACQFQEHFLQL